MADMTESDLQAAVRTAGNLSRAWRALISLIVNSWKQLAGVGIIACISGASADGIDFSWLGSLEPGQRAMGVAVIALWLRLSGLEAWCRAELFKALSASTKASMQASKDANDIAARFSVHSDQIDRRLLRMEASLGIPMEIPTGSVAQTALAPKGETTPFPVGNDAKYAETEIKEFQP